MRRPARLVTLTFALVGALAPSGCGGDDDSSPAVAQDTGSAAASSTPAPSSSPAAATDICAVWDDFRVAVSFEPDQPLDMSALREAELPPGADEASQHGRDVIVAFFDGKAPNDIDGDTADEDDSAIGAFGDLVENACLDPGVQAMASDADSDAFCQALAPLVYDIDEDPVVLAHLVDDAERIIEAGTSSMDPALRHGVQLFVSQVAKLPVDEDPEGLESFTHPIGTQDSADVDRFNDDETVCPDLQDYH
jgi:hypothetical protein